MPCYYPIDAYREQVPNANGKRPLKFNRKGESREDTIQIRCGRCIGCRQDKAQDWAVRCSHEMQIAEERELESSFITLTYNDEHLPNPPSINKSDPHRFINNLRKYLTRTYGKETKIRFFGCGEYGSQLDRPHYHFIIFGYQFTDLELHTENYQGNKIYISETLDRLWGKGFATTAFASYQTAHYVARYIFKKINGDRAEDHYSYFDSETGELHSLEPEFNTSSRMPGLGYNWLQKYKNQLHKGYVIIDGKKKPIPDYYLRKLMETENEQDDDYELYEYLKALRLSDVDPFHPDMSGDRLRIREEVKIRRLQTLKRT